jgi:hypothetical protein
VFFDNHSPIAPGRYDFVHTVFSFNKSSQERGTVQNDYAPNSALGDNRFVLHSV